MPRVLPDVHLGSAEELDVDVCAPGAQLTISDLDDRRRQDQQRDEQDADSRPDHEGSSGVDRSDDESRHRPGDSGRDQDPQRRAESLAVAFCTGGGSTGMTR